jgi:hypothetical protein
MSVVCSGLSEKRKSAHSPLLSDLYIQKKVFVVLEAVELVGNPQGCPSGGGQLEELSTGAPNPQLACFSRYLLSGNWGIAI